MTLKAEDVLTQWKLETGQSVQNIDEIYKRIKREAREEKKLDTVRQELNKTTKKSAFLTKALAHATGNILAMAFTKATQAGKDLIKTGLQWEDWIGENTHGLDELSKSIDGMANKMDLARVRSQLMGNEFGFNEKQIQAVLKASVDWMRINKDELAPSIQKITDAVRTGRDSVFRKLGFDVEFLGSKAEKTAKGMALLLEQYGDAEVQIENTNEAVMAAGAAWDDLTAEFTASLIKGLALKKMFVDLRDILRSMEKFKGFGFTGKMQEWIDDAARARFAGAKATAGGTAAVPPGVFQPVGIEGGGAEFVSKTKIKRKTSTGKTLKLVPSPVEGHADPGAAGIEAMRRAEAASEELENQIEDMSASIGELPAFAVDAAVPALDILGEALIRVKELGINAFASLAAGMWDAAEAAVQGSKSFARAMADMLQSVLMAVAKEATVLAAMSMAKGIAAAFTPGGQGASVGHYTAAAMFAGVAATAGAAGLGMSAAGFGGVGGARSTGGGWESKVPGAVGHGQSFGRTAETDTVIHVHIEMPSSRSGAADYMNDQILTTRITAAQKAA